MLLMSKDWKNKHENHKEQLLQNTNPSARTGPPASFQKNERRRLIPKTSKTVTSLKSVMSTFF